MLKRYFFQAFGMMSLFYIGLLLSGCLSRVSSAPVVNAWQQPAAQKEIYKVGTGDTVYSIAWTFGLDYRALARANGLRPPYRIRAGQSLRMAVSSLHSISRIEQPKKRLAKYRNQSTFHWIWPARGRILDSFSSNLAGNRGIDISGRLGEPIHAAASGEVVYSGDGVRGYGNLLIIKHNDNYLSAYAFNKELLVKLGQRVRVGQVVAKMGHNNAGCVMLHFEIRKNGRPVNPERYLK